MGKQWSIFCRVIDNFGDIGVCWRLAADLGARGEHVTLWLDDASALAWMAPHGAPGVSVKPWDSAAAQGQPGDVVIEAFGCELPAPFVARMAKMPAPPVWINLEYLSAEAYVERSHRLPSPQFSGPGQGLTKWFFYPGFTPHTGGLLREPKLIAARDALQRDPAARHAWLQQWGAAPRTQEHCVSVLAYRLQGLAQLLERAVGQVPTLLLLTAGAPEPPALPAHVRCIRLPFLSQADYDRLLWCCDLNLVRGEDSFVRAQWAERPFVWQIYPQHDGAHKHKLDAFFDLHEANLLPASATLIAQTACTAHAAYAAHANALRQLAHAWNGAAEFPSQPIDLAAWRTHCAAWSRALQAQPDLGTQLLAFAAAHMHPLGSARHV